MTTQHPSIVEVFATQVACSPKATALITQQRRIDYQTLDCRANFLAQHLTQLGIGKEQSVAMMMPRGDDFIVALLAILKVGAVYMPLDASLPEKRLQHCLTLAECHWIITDKRLPVSLTQGRHLINAADTTLFRSSLAAFQTPCISGDSPCYIMFTSGSTGKPKGVLAPHRGVTRLVIEPNYATIQADDTLLQLAPVTFDAATFEIWGALLNGASLVLYPEDNFDPFVFADQVTEHQVSVLWVTAALFHLIAGHFNDALQPVKQLLSGGDVLGANQINSLLDKFPSMTLVNAYGPTENTTFTTCHVITQANRPCESVPIGKAINHTQVHILDSQRRPVKQGETGELYTSGAGVALGYLGELGESEKGFFRDERIAPGLIYRTGDLVQQNDKGEIMFIGRIDNQVKIRGFRVNLEEPQQAIKDIPGVLDAAVVLRQLDAGGQALAAYVLPEGGATICESKVQNHLAELLPSYMVPEFIHITSQLPVNANGKIDRKKILEIAA